MKGTVAFEALGTCTDLEDIRAEAPLSSETKPAGTSVNGGSGTLLAREGEVLGRLAGIQRGDFREAMRKERQPCGEEGKVGEAHWTHWPLSLPCCLAGARF